MTMTTSAPGPEQQSPPRKRRTGRYVLVGAGVLVVLATLAATIFLWTLYSSFDTRSHKLQDVFPDESGRPTQAVSPDGSSAMNVLIVGSDSRGATKDEAESGEASDQRSDTMMLVHVPADRRKMYAVSIMRDLWVPIPGHGNAKINAALAYGGVPLMVQTVEGFLNQRIDHVVFIDFDGFKGLTDAVGGVDVDVPVAFTPSWSGGSNITFPEGPMHMDGEAAFWFVHERYAFPDGDFQRTKNQQLYFQALTRKILSQEVLTNPFTVSKLVADFSPYLSVDAQLTPGAIASIAVELRDVRPGDLVTFTLPTNGTGWSDDGQSIVAPDQDAVNALSKAMTDGTMAQYPLGTGH
ncbi:LCP family protein [Paenarthrobacter ilicis]|uniref:LCP family protein required for cell wall assembly n=1 Tax=Paenarthrobacter ilicis TaxID=43665 RepID=A0ABX0TJA2_9MICC|nr:LCP family protein [Paenarthrobacter ilicis]MBM7794987.1 LCP family protein required for cell wall assembly [Paenarthrobacter ilicis]NIJ02618.1 LCP family protein required for cell wall assembly [Paenarthrobacter ilicis]